MLEKWLEELAEDEMKKKASAQFEEVLENMDIPELKAFFDLNQDLEKEAQTPAVDPFAPRMVQAPAINREDVIRESEAHGRGGGAVAGGLLGGTGLGLLGGAVGQRLGGSAGRIGGGLLGATLGAVGGGYGGAKGLGALARRAAEGASDEAMQAGANFNLAVDLHGQGKISDEEFALAEQNFLRSPAMGGQLVPQSQQVPVMPGAQEKMSSAKIKQAIDAGQALAQAGFVPKVIEESFSKEAGLGDIGEAIVKGVGKLKGKGSEALGKVRSGYRGGRLDRVMSKDSPELRKSLYAAQPEDLAERAGAFAGRYTPHLVAGGTGAGLLGAGALGGSALTSKTASLRETIIEVAEKGGLPKTHGWELSMEKSALGGLGRVGEALADLAGKKKPKLPSITPKQIGQRTIKRKYRPAKLVIEKPAYKGSRSDPHGYARWDFPRIDLDA